MPNFTLLCPADAIAAEKMVTLAAETKGPVYLRLGRGATPVIYEKDHSLRLVKLSRLEIMATILQLLVPVFVLLKQL